MKLATFFPKSQALNRTSFYDVGDSRRLSFRVKHVVNGKIANLSRDGEGNIDYNFDFKKKADFVGGLVVEGHGYMGMQSSDLVAQAVEALRPRTSYSFSKVVNTKFDMRALCFVLGAATAVGCGGCDFDVPQKSAGYRTLGMGWSIPDTGDVVFGPNIVSSSNEFVTLLALCGEAGVSSATFLTDSIPGSDGRFLVGRPLAAYATRVAANVFAAAHEAMCVGAHKKAFESGKGCAFTLNAHSDEGGWIRNLLGSVSYPKSVGFVFGTGVEFCGLPLQERVDVDEVLRLTLSEYLEFIALFPVADILLHGEHSVLYKDAGAQPRPSSFEPLGMQVHAVTEKVRQLLCDTMGLHHDANQDIGAHTGYLNRNSVDRHFEQEVIVPWFFVEYAPCLVDEYPEVWTPAHMGKITKLPLFETKAVGHTSPTLDQFGRCVPGSEIWMVRPPTSFRREGASYLLSSNYNAANGLGCVTNEAQGLDGTPGSDLAFVAQDAVSIAASRWVTPHNSLPNPVEGLSGFDTVFKLTVALVRESPTPEEVAFGMVESRFSAFSVVTDVPSGKASSHRHVPAYLRRRLKFIPDVQSHFTEIVANPDLRTRNPEQVTSPASEINNTDESPAEAATPAYIGDPDSKDPDGPSATASPAPSVPRPVAATTIVGKPQKIESSKNGD